MINLLSPSPPPIPLAPDGETNSFYHLMNLLALLTNPDRHRKHLGEIFEARMAWQDAKSEAQKALKELDVARTEHDAQIKAERDEHDRSIAEARAKFDNQCGRDMSEVRLKLENATMLEAQAKADATAAATLRADLEARLEKIKQAAA